MSSPDASRGQATYYATCKQRLDSPHWSRRGRTVLFKTYVRCIGNMTSIRVQVRTFLARRKKGGEFVLVAAGLQAQTITVNSSQSKAFYCPLEGRGIHVRGDGYFRGASTLAIVEPGGITSDPVTAQTAITYVVQP